MSACCCCCCCCGPPWSGMFAAADDLVCQPALMPPCQVTLLQLCSLGGHRPSACTAVCTSQWSGAAVQRSTLRTTAAQHEEQCFRCPAYAFTSRFIPSAFTSVTQVESSPSSRSLKYQITWPATSAAKLSMSSWEQQRPLSEKGSESAGTGYQSDSTSGGVSGLEVEKMVRLAWG